MKIISCVSLAGGQGKTTCSLFTARYLAHQNQKVLLIDADPQSSLTTFLRFEVDPEKPTILEVLKREVETKEGIYPTEYDNLYLIPSDDALDTVQDYLANTGTGALALQRRLKPVAKLFDYCLIDSPPQRSQITLAAIGASHGLVIPVEASVKGLQSAVRTLELIQDLKEEDEDFGGEIIGLIPFRDKWVGRSQTNESKKNIEKIQNLTQEWFGKDLVLPSILESEKYKQGINKGLTLHELNHSVLAYPIEFLISKIEELDNE